ncbi:MucR family transcriptional regulator [Sphingomonas lenta]|uniref:MucR family transcriptional regulator n=1 Tax=Sphingomonas lenta TaxID=1141887 RepID=UPI001FEAEC03|nr:MucR family transcriptional regulator [Sphingomonas lenta]
MLAAEITAAWLRNPSTRASADEVPTFLARMYEAVSGLEQPQAVTAEEPEAEAFTPAVSVRKSLANPDHIVSMIDGKPYKTLRRHLATRGLTPEQYRERYGLKPDYPMTAANYSEARRAMAKRIGLGRKPAQSAAPEDTGAAASDAPKRARGKTVGA